MIYIIVDHLDGGELPYTGLRPMGHVGLKDAHARGGKVVGAGFVRWHGDGTCTCWGGSDGLRVDARPFEDGQILEVFAKATLATAPAIGTWHQRGEAIMEARNAPSPEGANAGGVKL